MDNCIDPRDDRSDWVDLLVDTTLRRYRCSESARRLDTQQKISWILIPLIQSPKEFRHSGCDQSKTKV